MKEIFIQKFCALCGRTSYFKSTVKFTKKLYIVENGEQSDLGYMCDGCYNHLEQGKVFTRPRKPKEKTPS